MAQGVKVMPNGARGGYPLSVDRRGPTARRAIRQQEGRRRARVRRTKAVRPPRAARARTWAEKPGGSLEESVSRKADALLGTNQLVQLAKMFIGSHG